MSLPAVKTLLVASFNPRHVDALLKHYVDAAHKFSQEDWDGVALKAGKFVEAVTKALMLYCAKPLPANMRHFKAGVELRQLEKADPKYGDIIRLVIPKACVFAYEVVNNRGGRHDPGEIDANAMDARVILPIVQWILAELVRFTSVGGDTKGAAKLIDEITVKIYPHFEDIDGRTYVNVDGLGAPDIALLLLYSAYPARLDRKELIASIARHGPKETAASMAVHRLRTFVDDSGGRLKLRANGRQKAEQLIKDSK